LSPQSRPMRRGAHPCLPSAARRNQKRRRPRLRALLRGRDGCDLPLGHDGIHLGKRRSGVAQLSRPRTIYAYERPPSRRLRASPASIERPWRSRMSLLAAHLHRRHPGWCKYAHSYTAARSALLRSRKMTNDQTHQRRCIARGAAPIGQRSALVKKLHPH
jgi:hypothetical protein